MITIELIDSIIRSLRNGNYKLPNVELVSISSAFLTKIADSNFYPEIHRFKFRIGSELFVFAIYFEESGYTCSLHSLI